MSLNDQEVAMSAQLQELVLGCNKLAMDYLRKENFAGSLHLLRRAQDILGLPHPLSSKIKLLSITYNNLGCFYKKVGKYNLALQFLQKAIEIGSNSPTDFSSQAGTHLNICAIKSQLGNHDEAVKSVQRAIRFLLEAEKFEKTPNIINTAAIAYYNAGIEYELLGNINKALEHYRLGIEKAKLNSPNTHPVLELLLKNYNILQASKEKNFNGSGKIYQFERTNREIKPIHQRATSTQSNRHQKLDGTLPVVRISSAKPKDRRQNKSFDLGKNHLNIMENSNLSMNDGIAKSHLRNGFQPKLSKPKIYQDASIIRPNPVPPSQKPRPATGRRKIIRQASPEEPFNSIEEKLKQLECQLALLERRDENFRDELNDKDSLAIFSPIKP